MQLGMSATSQLYGAYSANHSRNLLSHFRIRAAQEPTPKHPNRLHNCQARAGVRGTSAEHDAARQIPESLSAKPMSPTKTVASLSPVRGPSYGVCVCAPMAEKPRRKAQEMRQPCGLFDAEAAWRT